ncbi:MAG TPA: M23 family metallopeptidase [Gemmatimonadales bacterium]|nr:M23 family metallopeptidase [Gemmatimonadales bacterium]
MTTLLFCAVLGFMAAAPCAAQGLQRPDAVSWRPAYPTQGALVSLVVRPESLAAVGESPVIFGGVAAGEPLHFEATVGGPCWALVPIPLDATDSLIVRITIARRSGSDTVSLTLPVFALAGDTEQLRTPAKFAGPLDSAMAARVANEEGRMLAALHRSHDTSRLWQERFVRPVAGRVTSAFGLWREFNGALEGRHSGVDLAGRLGAPVRAANRGVVVLLAEFYYGGLTVVIDHGGGLVTTYDHLSRASVQVGDTVQRGHSIGHVGATGRATGPHLHWGAYYGTISVDPFALLALELPSRQQHEP